MRKEYLLFGFISAISLMACNKSEGPQKVEYEEFYAKMQEIEVHYYSHATLHLSYFDDLSGDGKTIEKTLNYTWDTEANKFVPDETYEVDLADEMNKTIKDKFKKSQESEESKSLGFQYFINPFKAYVDYTETIEERTIRTVESQTYDKYGYLIDYLLQATVHGTYKGEPINGTQGIAYSISYR